MRVHARIREGIFINLDHIHARIRARAYLFGPGDR